MADRRHIDSAGWRAAARAALFSGAAALPLLLPTRAAAENTGGKDITGQVEREVTVAMPSLNPLVERVLPAVVNISAQLNQEAEARPGPSAENGDQSPSPLDQFMQRFLENRGAPHVNRQVMALGSGFIIDPTGYVVTNNHVVGTGSKVSVILQDNSRHPATIVGRDTKSDLALLKIDVPQKLPYVSWGDSEKAKVGDWVMAVGNPFSLGGSVTAGIISAVGRDINEGPYDDFIQIDAPINRGNSGGPTFNLSGQVIGINTAIYSPSGGSVGIGFAVPSNTAKSVVEQLKENGHVTRGWLGVAIQAISPAIARGLGLDPDHPSGALVASITPNSPAAKAGVKQGDVIVAAGGRPIKSVHDLPRLVAATPPGHTLELTVKRGDKEEKITASVAEMPETPQVASTENPDEATSLGLQLSSMTPRLRSRFSIPPDVEGVVVTNVSGDSPAAALGLQPGDVIVSVDQQAATTAQQAADTLKQASAKGDVLLLVNRHGAAQFLGMSVGPRVGSGGGNPG